MGDSLQFDPVGHVYRLGGNVLPSVTEIMRSGGLVDFSRVPPETLRLAQERGTAVHTACHLYDQGKLDWSSLDPVVWPYIEGWMKFLDQTSFYGRLAETPVHSNIGFAGTFDRLGEINGRSVILDIKTSEIIGKATGAQLAAYLQACGECGHLTRPIKKYERFAVHLYDNGTYELEPYTNPQDWPVFQACLQIYHYHRRTT